MTTDSTPPSRLAALIAEGWALRDRFEHTLRDDDFHSFVAADYDAVRTALESLRTSAPAAVRLLEWGSASGVITVMADLMGFEAYGIEIDGSLVTMARDLAERFDSGAKFVTGSFLPTGYVRRDGRDDDEEPDTIGEGPSGYLQLGMALDDFDVVFAFPWPGDAGLMLDVMQRYGRRDALMLLYDVNAGVRAYRGGRTEVQEHGYSPRSMSQRDRARG